MQTAILIASYSKDLPYLLHNLRSIEKFATGFSEIVVVVPSEERMLFVAALNNRPVHIATYNRTPDTEKWQIHAQAVKCMADRWCPRADYVLHTDSDCIFTEPVTPDDYFANGKPVMLYQSFASMPPGCPWQPVMEKTLKRKVDYEFMRRHPQVNPIGIYPAMRLHIGLIHQQAFEPWVLAQKAQYPWGFTEHNTIGAFAWYSPNWKDEYHWINCEKEPWPHSKLMQFWSHSPPNEVQDSPTGGPRVAPIEIINKLLA